MKKDWAYYCGDPCYVIPDEDWDDFCRLFWKTEEDRRSEIRKYLRAQGKTVPGYISLDGLSHFLDWKGETIEVMDSPGGDGCWSFSDSVKQMEGWVSGEEMPVDAGLLAVVPRSVCEERNGRVGPGILFTISPFLETGHNIDGQVKLNEFYLDGLIKCDECERYTEKYMFEHCDNCGEGACCGLGCNCEKCDECDTWTASYQESCECCDACELLYCECE